jgi:hypothetical protein
MEVVREVMKEDRRARRDRKWLSYKVMRRYTKIFIPYQDFLKIPSFESIAKCARDILNKNNEFPEDFVAEEGVTYEQSNKQLAKVD